MSKDLLQYIPFVGLAMQGAQSHISNPIIIRLMEAAIIGGVTMYGTTQAIGVKMEVLSEQVAELKADQKRMQNVITKLRIAVGK